MISLRSFGKTLSVCILGVMTVLSFPVLAKSPGGKGKTLRLGTAVDDERTVEIKGPGALESIMKAVSPSANVDVFFAAPLGKPNDPNKYKYIGPIVGGHDPSKIDWSRYGAQTAEQKRFFMVEYAQGRLKIGAEFGGIDPTTDPPPYHGTKGEASKPAPKTSPAPKSGPTRGPTTKPTTEENGEQAWINTIQNPTIAPKSAFREEVNGAIDRVIHAGTGLEGPGSTKIVSYDAYHAAVVDELRKKGFLALHDGEELAIGRAGDPSFSEQFDISTASGLVRRFYAAYIKPAVPALQTTGGSGTPEKGQPTPASKAPVEGMLPPSQIIPDVPGQKALINSIKNPNVAPKSRHRGSVNKAIDSVISAGIGLKDPGSEEIADYDAYHAAVVSELRKMGYSAAHDGEELAIKLPGQDFNEQFDISTASGRVRRFYAAWLQPPSIGD